MFIFTWDPSSWWCNTVVQWISSRQRANHLFVFGSTEHKRSTVISELAYMIKENSKILWPLKAHRPTFKQIFLLHLILLQNNQMTLYKHGWGNSCILPFGLELTDHLLLAVMQQCQLIHVACWVYICFVPVHLYPS